MYQLRFRAVNVAREGFGLDSLVAEPEVVFLVTLEHPAVWSVAWAEM